MDRPNNRPRLTFSARITVACMAMLLLAPAGARAVDEACKKPFAGETMRFIVPHSPGGGYDTYARLMQPFFEKIFATKMVVENIEAGGGLVGANEIKDAKPDGLTVGILNSPGLMMSHISEEADAPNPAEDFTILARLDRSQQVWVTGASSEINTVDEMLARTGDEPFVFAVREVNSTSFLNTVISPWLLGLKTRIVAGFEGSRDTTLAVIRGDVDATGATFESILDRIDAGELRPLLQVSDAPIGDHASLVGVPVLGGKDGVAARRAATLGRDVDQALADATALARLLGGGRLIAAPRGLPAQLEACLESGVMELLEGAEFRAAAAKAQRGLETAPGDVAVGELRAAAIDAKRFLPLLNDAIAQLRE